MIVPFWAQQDSDVPFHRIRSRRTRPRTKNATTWSQINREPHSPNRVCKPTFAGGAPTSRVTGPPRSGPLRRQRRGRVNPAADADEPPASPSRPARGAANRPVRRNRCQIGKLAAALLEEKRRRPAPVPSPHSQETHNAAEIPGGGGAALPTPSPNFFHLFFIGVGTLLGGWIREGRERRRWGGRKRNKTSAEHSNGPGTPGPTGGHLAGPTSPSTTWPPRTVAVQRGPVRGGPIDQREEAGARRCARGGDPAPVARGRS